jgi:hypothetical protein
VKGLAKNKVVKTVAKAALCTAVPGGSMIAGAIDAKKAKGAAGAVAGAAAGLATGGGGSCMPGMGLAGKAGVAASIAGVPGGVPGMPTTGMPAAELSTAQMSQLAAPGAAMSPEQMKQMAEQYQKMGMQPAQIKAMQQQMLAMQQMLAQTPNPSAGPAEGQSAGTTAPPTVAVGTSSLSVEKGGLALHHLPWMPGSSAIQAGAEAVFGVAMRDMAAAIQATGKSYKVEVRVEEQGKKAQNRQLSHARGAAVIAGLVAEGIPSQRLKLVDAGSDKDARVLLHETK